MTKAIPVFRVFDYKKTIEFYVDWLGFTINWEHKPEGSPFYMQVSIRGVAIDLSEHHGECSPGAKVILNDFEGLTAYHKLISEKDFKYMNPGLERTEWDIETITTTVIDPFMNQIIFTERVGK
ncbi:glyoxalase superfamily protein [Mucilaginibacter boryungensis]|uniref:Bleomycin resistance protein n=1 Tax=Mucilaginibacter boryungensis TaxID=768480 RepID=A0ABR9XGZ3_9SPHI|nr:glyoxalase superfamily protein [Mucilaginibacter boryungensis]MBE9666657.1 VOC family protein [Mucilaginibacter boryungensis]